MDKQFKGGYGTVSFINNYRGETLAAKELQNLTLSDSDVLKILELLNGEPFSPELLESRKKIDAISISPDSFSLDSVEAFFNQLIGITNKELRAALIEGVIGILVRMKLGKRRDLLAPQEIRINKIGGSWKLRLLMPTPVSINKNTDNNLIEHKEQLQTSVYLKLSNLLISVIDLHKAGIFHRDLKLSNLLEIDSNTYGIIDYGTAAYLNTTHLSNLHSQTALIPIAFNQGEIDVNQAYAAGSRDMLRPEFNLRSGLLSDLSQNDGNALASEKGITDKYYQHDAQNLAHIYFEVLTGVSWPVLAPREENGRLILPTAFEISTAREEYINNVATIENISHRLGIDVLMTGKIVSILKILLSQNVLDLPAVPEFYLFIATELVKLAGDKNIVNKYADLEAIVNVVMGRLEPSEVSISKRQENFLRKFANTLKLNIGDANILAYLTRKVSDLEGQQPLSLDHSFGSSSAAALDHNTPRSLFDEDTLF